MYPMVRCPSCNNSVSEFYDLYDLLKNELYSQDLKKINLNKAFKLKN